MENIQGLEAILAKEEIIGTYTASDLRYDPALVKATYREHVRTYIPLGRESGPGGEGFSVKDFERRLIRLVQESQAPVACVIGRYGYGKTSTGLYLWQQAEEKNLLAVPPFQFSQLYDLVESLYGWLHFAFRERKPSLLDKLEELYQNIVTRRSEDVARRYGISVESAQRMAEEGRLIVEMRPTDYIHFFEESVRLAQEAGFQGILLIADEAQYYTHPLLSGERPDEIKDFFNIIQLLRTRKGYLPFGLVLFFPPHEWNVLRERRGDLVQRSIALILNLEQVYDREFPLRLWERLARTFNFEEHKYRIVTPETLLALGEIAAREDLSDGPRTVINAFKQMIRRYIDEGFPGDHPYTPEDLIDDFLSKNISFDTSQTIPTIVRRVLQHSTVRGNPARERAVKWAAAFPIEGIRPQKLYELGLEDVSQALEELTEAAVGDFLVKVGSPLDPGITLTDLKEGVKVTDWLAGIIRDFQRSFSVSYAESLKADTFAALEAMLKSHVFQGKEWKLITRFEANLVHNAGLILKGPIQGTVDKKLRVFPARRIYVRFLWENEPVRGKMPEDADVEIRFILNRHLEIKNPEERQRLIESVRIIPEEHRLEIPLNLRYFKPSLLVPGLEEQLGAFISPFSLDPLLMLALHQRLEREKSRAPRDEVGRLETLQNDLLDSAFNLLFTAEAGRELDAGGEAIIREGLLHLLHTRYPDYAPLIRGQWKSVLRDYIRALRSLSSPLERQGMEPVKGTKEEIAHLFGRTHTALDNLIASYPELLKVEIPFKGKQPGALRFRLHPLEEQIRRWLETSDRTRVIERAGRREEAKYLIQVDLESRARALGYRDEEIDFILQIMETRRLIELDVKGLVQQAIRFLPTPDELMDEMRKLLQQVKDLHRAFPSAQLQNLSQRIEEGISKLKAQKGLDEQTAYIYQKTLQIRKQELLDLVRDRQQDLRREVTFLRDKVVPIPSHWKKALEPLEKAEFAIHIERRLRIPLLKQLKSLEEERNDLYPSIQEMIADLARPDLALEELVTLAQRIQKLKRKVQKWRSLYEGLEQNINYYRDWRELAERAAQLQGDLNYLGDLLPDEQEEWEELSRDIAGLISSQRLKALPEALTFKEHLRRIQGKVEERKRLLKEEFLRLQNRYMRVLEDNLRLPPEWLWDPILYDLTSPELSYERLYKSVNRCLEEVAKHFINRSEWLKENLLSIQRSVEENFWPPEVQAELNTEIEDFLSRLEILREEAASLRETLENNPDLARDFPEKGEGKLHKWLNQARALRPRFEALEKRIKALENRFQSLEIGREAQQLLKLLQELSQGREEIDWGEALREACSRLGEESIVWDALRELQAKRRIRLRVQIIK